MSLGNYLPLQASSLDKALSLFWGMPEMRCGLLRLLLKLKIALLVRIKEQSSVFPFSCVIRDYAGEIPGM
jgi:hypothetical protein